MNGVVAKFNAGGGLEDSYAIPRILPNNGLQCFFTLFFDDGSYIVFWISESYNSGFAIGSNSFLYS